jgi:hypothetical protein
MKAPPKERQLSTTRWPRTNPFPAWNPFRTWHPIASSEFFQRCFRAVAVLALTRTALHMAGLKGAYHPNVNHIWSPKATTAIDGWPDPDCMAIIWTVARNQQFTFPFQRRSQSTDHDRISLTSAGNATRQKLREVRESQVCAPMPSYAEHQGWPADNQAPVGWEQYRNTMSATLASCVPGRQLMNHQRQTFHFWTVWHLLPVWSGCED